MLLNLKQCVILHLKCEFYDCFESSGSQLVYAWKSDIGVETPWSAGSFYQESKKTMYYRVTSEKTNGILDIFNHVYVSAIGLQYQN